MGNGLYGTWLISCKLVFHLPKITNRKDASRTVSNGIFFNQPISICQTSNRFFYHSQHFIALVIISTSCIKLMWIYLEVRLRVAYLFGTSCESNTLFRLSLCRIPAVFNLVVDVFSVSRDSNQRLFVSVAVLLFDWFIDCMIHAMQMWISLA